MIDKIYKQKGPTFENILYHNKYYNFVNETVVAAIDRCGTRLLEDTKKLQLPESK